MPQHRHETLVVTREPAPTETAAPASRIEGGEETS